MDELITALERHKSSEGPSKPPRIHYFPPRLTDLPPLETGPTIYQRDQPSSSHPLPYPSYSNPQTALSSPSSTRTSSPPSPPSPMQRTTSTRLSDAPFIDPNETAGLPASSSNTDVNAKAADIVRAHTKRRGFGLRAFVGKRKGKSSKSESKFIANSSNEKQKQENGFKSYDFALHRPSSSIDHDHDIEREAEGNNLHGTSIQGGVLSALLGLYNDDASLPSGMTTPGSIMTTASETVREKEPSPSRGYFSSSIPQQKARLASVVTTTRSAPVSPTDSLDSPRHSRVWNHGNGSQGSLSSYLPAMPTLIKSRPVQARNGAGVFGSLIASTGNLSGMATPMHSQVQPNVKRPGYHLSRFVFVSFILLLEMY